MASQTFTTDDAQSPSTVGGDRAQYVPGTMPSREWFVVRGGQRR